MRMETKVRRAASGIVRVLMDQAANQVAAVVEEAGRTDEVHSPSMKDPKVKKRGPGPLDRAVSENLGKLRAKAGLSQEQLGRRASLSTSYVSMLERGSRSAPLDTLWALAKALRVPPERLLRRKRT